MTFETSIKGVFAGGDLVIGPLSVIDAISSGKKVARAIDLYLRGEDLSSLKVKRFKEGSWVREPLSLNKKEKPKVTCLSVEERRGNFREVEIAFELEEGMIEALRCLHCGPCNTCLSKEDLCEPDSAIVDVEA
ncbi:MAG: hypothetical protein ACUVV4_01995 [Candidatus Bathyarchaeia archaeon]